MGVDDWSLLNRSGEVPAVLLVGPYDPHCGEYTFVAPPLGVWRLAGVLRSHGIPAEVFDPNCCDGDPQKVLRTRLIERHFAVVGFSTTGMTLRFDLALAHAARAQSPASLLVAGGMEATFRPDLMFQLGPFDLAVLGEGERPLLEIVRRLQQRADLAGIAGTSWMNGGLHRLPQPALEGAEMREAIFATPYQEMPYRSYWDRLEKSYAVGSLPVKAEREARLSEIRSVRLITLNYCPMGCTFCSSTNFLDAAQGSTARIARLDVDECVAMIKRITSAQPDVRTVIFQDDIFVFTADSRILPLCDAIIRAKRQGEIPADLQFISTNRIDSMTPERLKAMRAAGFRVLGFGVESFSREILREFNKARIYPTIEPTLSNALALGFTPFLDLILTSPRCTLSDLAETIRRANHWIAAGCEVGMYPYIIPFSGAAMAQDPALEEQTIYSRRRVAGTAIEWNQATKILPLDRDAREAILNIEASFECWLRRLESMVSHIPSRVRSYLWILCATPVLEAAGEGMPEIEVVLNALSSHLPTLGEDGLELLREHYQSCALRRAV